MTTHHSAVIFDVDGPLLHLTEAESAAFFIPFREAFDLTDLSEDWDSYRIRNDVEIYREVLIDRLGMPATDQQIADLRDRYCALLIEMFNGGEAEVSAILGIHALLASLQKIEGLALGTATANFESAAQMRLERVNLWKPLSDFHSGAEGGGAKRDILARVIDRLSLPPDRIVFLGDNLNDLEAAQASNTHFIGFHTDAKRRNRLSAAGATTVSGDHTESLSIVRAFLDL